MGQRENAVQHHLIAAAQQADSGKGNILCGVAPQLLRVLRQKPPFQRGKRIAGNNGELLPKMALRPQRKAPLFQQESFFRQRQQDGLGRCIKFAGQCQGGFAGLQPYGLIEAERPPALRGLDAGQLGIILQDNIQRFRAEALNNQADLHQPMARQNPRDHLPDTQILILE